MQTWTLTCFFLSIYLFFLFLKWCIYYTKNQDTSTSRSLHLGAKECYHICMLDLIYLFSFSIVLWYSFALTLCNDTWCTFLVPLTYFCGLFLEINKTILSYAIWSGNYALNNFRCGNDCKQQFKTCDNVGQTKTHLDSYTSLVCSKILEVMWMLICNCF